MIRTLAFFIALAWAVSARAIAIDTVPVGNVGNPYESINNPFGGVDYAYRIGKYEVTISQYTAFLNAVAATDTYALYNPNMAMDLNIAGIAQSGSPGSYTYSVIGSPNHPVTYVSFGDAARFANWLHNGQHMGLQNSTTTEDGAYTLNGAISESALTFASRQANAKWFIPRTSEWYKAAYYQPATVGGDADNYWTYPMRTNSVPYSDQPLGATPDNTRVANFYRDDGTVNSYNDGFAATGSTNRSASQNYLTDAGAYTLSPSYYGTFDQGGNVSEWNENAGNVGGFYFRDVRGGSWVNSASFLAASNSSLVNPALEQSDIGFRVATVVPEPGTVAILFIGSVATILRRRRKSLDVRVSRETRSKRMTPTGLEPVLPA
jgi:formylglycine-generating enzyme required for sulfatase activity